jgi:UDP-N-acetylmuramoyl-tripeptide--D-alanyl-D-alanine ligase
MSAAFTAREILEATGGAVRGSLAERFAGVSTDTRSIPEGALFVALEGDTFDAHDFLDKAREAGAAGAVVRRGARVPAGLCAIEVDDTLAALGGIARYHRRRFAIPVGAVTGSNGKTTTKEMIGAILAAGGASLKTEGNLNNEVGVPLTLLRLTSEHRSAVVEMGMNHEGELARLSAIAEPDCAEIVSVGPAHLAALKTVEAVARAKGEIFLGLKPEGLAIASADVPLLRAQARASGRRVLLFGRSPDAQVQLARVEGRGAQGLEVAIRHQGREHRCRLSFLGEHNALNACAAFAMGASLGASPEQCVAGLEAARPWAHRLALVEAPGGFAVIDDCYNANPASTAAALDTLASLGGERRRVAVLGDMLELGEAEEGSHRAIGEKAAEVAPLVVAFGPRAKSLFEAARAKGAEAFHFEDPAAAGGAVELLKKRLRPGDLVLVKGSRGMKMERIVEGLTGVSGGAH